MTEYIDKRAVYEVACRGCTRHGDEPMSCYDSEPCEKLNYAFASAPAADVAPVRHGRWIRLDANKGVEQFKCSFCRSECYVPTCMREPMYAFCPNCGARIGLGGAGDAEE